MKIIADIRVYKSDIENIEGNPLPHGFAEKPLNIILRRITMKLRENSFSLGEFDHLYLNFTPCLPCGEIEPSKRSVDSYHPWYRFYDVGVENAAYESIEKKYHIVLEMVRKTLICHFSKDNPIQIIESSIAQALQEGENMTMLLKEKKSAKNIARIYLRLMDNGMYRPLLRIFDLNDEEIFCADLQQMLDLSALGEIQLNSKRVMIKPRKNAFAKEMKPIIYELKQ